MGTNNRQLIEPTLNVNEFSGKPAAKLLGTCCGTKDWVQNVNVNTYISGEVLKHAFDNLTNYLMDPVDPYIVGRYSKPMLLIIVVKIFKTGQLYPQASMDFM